MNYGVRYDYFHNSYPEQHIGPEILAPARNITFPAMDGWSLHDLSPRFGAMYDVGGQGTTALKVSLNRYVLAMGPDVSFIQLANPSRNLVTQSTRSWGDADRDHVPDCDLVNPLRNGECGPLSNRNFGTVVSTVSYDEDGLTGWGHRSFNWEFPAGVEGDRLNVTTGRDNALTGLQQQRVNQVSDDMDGGQSLNRYLNPAAFAQPAPGTLGNFERNSLVGPSFWSVNVAVAKLVPTTTVQTLELRLEAFNLFNTFNWGNPTTNFNSGNFGRILSQAGDPRVLQFGVKYGF
jgi:hypothetical protein